MDSSLRPPVVGFVLCSDHLTQEEPQGSDKNRNDVIP